jgi:hypothetical protein
VGDNLLQLAAAGDSDALVMASPPARQPQSDRVPCTRTAARGREQWVCIYSVGLLMLGRAVGHRQEGQVLNAFNKGDGARLLFQGLLRDRAAPGRPDPAGRGASSMQARPDPLRPGPFRSGPADGPGGPGLPIREISLGPAPICGGARADSTPPSPLPGGPGPQGLRPPRSSAPRHAHPCGGVGAGGQRSWSWAGCRASRMARTMSTQ